MVSKKIAFKSVGNFEQFMSVMAAGIFFVPAAMQGEPFPGAQVFFSPRETAYWSVKEKLVFQTMNDKYQTNLS